MFQTKYLALLHKAYMFCLKITGFWPFDYDSQLRRYKLNLRYVVVPFILIPYIVIASALHANHLLNAVKFLFKNIVLKMISSIYISSNVFNFLFLYLTQTSQCKKIQKLIYRSINLNKSLCRSLQLKEVHYRSYLIKFTIKSLVFATTIVVYMSVSMTTIAPNVIKLYVLPGFLMPIVINKFYPDIHYGGMLLVDFYLLHINKDLKRVLNLYSKVLGNDKDLVDIVEQLDTISVNYVQLIEIVKEFHRIMSFRVIIWILIGLLNFLIHLFMQYVFIGIPIRYGHTLNIVISASGAIDLIYQFLEFWFLSSVCSSVMKRVEDTEIMLSSMYVQLRRMGPFERSIEMFLSCLKQQNLQITGCGMFSLDSTLIFSIVSTSASYLILLIQYELAM